jgi:hypothetical protein
VKRESEKCQNKTQCCNSRYRLVAYIYIVTEFCVKIGKNASETLAYGEYAVKKSSVFELRRQFKEGRDDPRIGKPKMRKSDANVDRVQISVQSD